MKKFKFEIGHTYTDGRNRFNYYGREVSGRGKVRYLFFDTRQFDKCYAFVRPDIDRLVPYVRT